MELEMMRGQFMDALMNPEKIVEICWLLIWLWLMILVLMKTLDLPIVMLFHLKQLALCPIAMILSKLLHRYTG